MAVRQSDVDRWRRLGKWGQLKKRNLYYGRDFNWAYKNVTPEEYPFWVLSNCDYYIVSGEGSLFPDIMETPIEDRERVAKAQEDWLQRMLKNLEEKREQR